MGAIGDRLEFFWIKIEVQFFSSRTSTFLGSKAKVEFQQTSYEMTLTGSRNHTRTPFLEMETTCRVNLV